MFGKSNGAEAAAKGPDPARVTVSTISATMSLKGDMDGEGDVVLEGSFDGAIRCRKLTVAESGILEGAVNAQEVTVSGVVKGEVTAKIVRLRATATVDGNVRHEVLEVEAGAKVEGHYSRDVQKAVVTPKSDLPKEEPPRGPKADGDKTGIEKSVALSAAKADTKASGSKRSVSS